MRFLWITFALLSTACVADTFRCHSNAECTNNGIAGRCESSGWCSFPDYACASGFRYAPSAPSELALTCSGETNDLGQPLDQSPAISDAAPTDESALAPADLADGNIESADASPLDLATGDLSLPDLSLPDLSLPDLLGLPDLYLPVTTITAALPLFDFGPMDFGGQTPTMKFFFTNSGAVTTARLGVSVTDYSSDFPITADGCNGITLAPGASCAVIARFRPITVGGRLAEFHVSDGTNSAVTQLYGQGTAPINYMFVTSTTHTGNLGGLAGADAICGSLASSAGLPGSYVALLSTSTVNAFDRIRNARGWKRTDGRVFADTATKLFNGLTRYTAPNLDESGNATAATVWTGTTPSGSADASCSDWSVADAGHSGQFGNALRGDNAWIAQISTACSGNFSLYCFQIDNVLPISLPLPQSRMIFPSQTLFIPGGGVAGADALCQNDAVNNGLPGTYKALLSTSAASGTSRFTIKHAPIWRPDGIIFATVDADILSANSPVTNATIGPDGSYRGEHGVWVGEGISPADCTGWTDASSSDQGGYNIAGYWPGYFTTNCSLSTDSIYCLQE